MKTRLLFAVLVSATLLLSSAVFAGENKNAPAPNSYEAIELNRLIGLASDNDGLKVSCAFNLGEMKSEKAVIPLIAMLRDGNSDEQKIIAALSLMKIGNAQGIYMVSRAAKFSDNSRVRYICEKFYNGYLLDHQNVKTSDTVASL